MLNKVFGGGWELQRMQDFVERETQQIRNNALLSGVYVTVDFPVAGADVTVDHGLGRAYTGYIVVEANVATSVYSPTANTSPDKKLIIRSSQIARLKLYIF